MCWLFAIHLNLRPGGGSEVAIRTLEGVCVQVRPLVVLHIRPSVKRLHAYSTGKPFSVHTGGAYSGGRGRRFTAQLMENRQGQRGTLLVYCNNIFLNNIFSYLHLLKDTVRQSWSQVEFFAFHVLWLRHLDSWRTPDLPITAVIKHFLKRFVYITII